MSLSNWETPVVVGLWVIVVVVIIAVALFAVAAFLAIKETIRTTKLTRQEHEKITNVFDELLTHDPKGPDKK